MNASLLLLKAVRNNVDWHDALARAHRLTPNILGGLWYCDQPMPSQLPNMITMNRKALNVAIINDLLGSLAPPWSIRDSFAEHPDHRRPFQVQSSVQWYFSEALSDVRESSLVETPEIVMDDATLTAWTDAWNTSTAQENTFPLQLLEYEHIKMIYFSTDAQIQCGAVLCFSQDVIGMSHLFGSEEEQQRLVRTIQLTYPERPIVGYGDDAELTLLKPFGFRTLGPLSILQTTATNPE